jgi:release factor glutamine methyltransferase
MTAERPKWPSPSADGADTSIRSVSSADTVYASSVDPERNAVTLGEAVQAARGRLIAAGIAPDEAALDAELLARHELGWDRAAFLSRLRETAEGEWQRVYDSLVERRLRREPLAYIRGVQEFWGRDFLVSPAVLIPRPETEIIVEEALGFIDRQKVLQTEPILADVGTGCGCLAVTLAAECPKVRIFATDVSLAALAVASQNALRHGVDGRITFLHGPHLDPIVGPLHLVVANPPYIADRDAASLPPEVAEYEPHEALFAGIDGLREVRALTARAATRLMPDGVLIVEIGAGQVEAVRCVVSGTPGLSLVRVRSDLQGIPRTAVIAVA